jgi:hypothetical protein
MIRPTDLPELRQEIVDWYTSGLADSYFDGMRESRREKGDGKVAAQGIGHMRREREGPAALQTAELFYIAADMVELAVHASKTIPDFALMPEDLPSPAGLIYTATPWWTFTHPEGGETQLVGLAWAPFPQDLVTGDGSIVQLIALAFLADREAYLAGHSDPNGWIRRHTPRIYEINGVSVWEIGNPMMEDRRYFLDAGLDTNPAMITKAMWTLMQQPIAMVEETHLDRTTRKRLERKQIDPRPVRVITLRRPRVTSSGQADREFRHQWIVRGHWRQQWYPSRQVHRPAWIAPHLKGPAGAPLLGGEKVYHWKR